MNSDNFSFSMRIFLAINLPQDIKERLADLQQEIKNSFPIEAADNVAKWVTPANLHLTLLFLGEVGEREVPFLFRTVEAVVKDIPPLVLQLTKICYGPAKKIPPQFIWLETKDNKMLEKLIVDLREKVSQAGIRHDDRGEGQWFFGHITLARIKEWIWRRIEPEERPEIEKELDIKVEARSIDLMESRLKRSGPEYIILQSFPLLGPD